MWPQCGNRDGTAKGLSPRKRLEQGQPVEEVLRTVAACPGHAPPVAHGAARGWWSVATVRHLASFGAVEVSTP